MHATIIMEGRLVTDPEIKSGKNGDYCTFRFVVNTKYGNQDNASFLQLHRKRVHRQSDAEGRHQEGPSDRDHR